MKELLLNTHYIVFLGLLLLIVIGLFGALTKRNLIKIFLMKSLQKLLNTLTI